MSESEIFKNIPKSTTPMEDITRGFVLVSSSISIQALRRAIRDDMNRKTLPIKGYKSENDRDELRNWAEEFWKAHKPDSDLSNKPKERSWVYGALVELRRKEGEVSKKRKRSISQSSENPVEQHVDIWNNKFPEFVEKIKDLPNTGTKLDSCFNFIKDAQRFGRRPRIYIHPKLQPAFGRGDSTLEDADLVYLSYNLAVEQLQESLHSYANKVIIIRDTFVVSRKVDTLESFISYHKQWPENKVGVQDFSQLLDAKHSAREFPISKILEDLADPNPRLTPENPPRNLLDLAPRGPFPHLYLGDNYTILDELLAKAKAHAIDSISKTGKRRHPLKDPDIHTLYEMLAQAYSGSLWHKDSIGAGAVLENVFGIKLWAIIVRMTDEQRLQFKADGEDWRPADQSVPLVCLLPGDRIFMQPGFDNVHGVITLRTSYMRGRNCWDDRKLSEILTQIVDQSQHSWTSNEDLPKDIREVANALWLQAKHEKHELLQAKCESVLKEFEHCRCDLKCSSNTCSSTELKGTGLYLAANLFLTISEKTSSFFAKLFERAEDATTGRGVSLLKVVDIRALTNYGFIVRSSDSLGPVTIGTGRTFGGDE
ncbi:hypothetical protein B0O99DRAFT_700856 [Bisporella sp. PMI_857]|nr:hypothetical protein B0O99DRAFT_700856 [Bisporella sp. PMI_857]